MYAKNQIDFYVNRDINGMYSKFHTHLRIRETLD